jgi:hypothetical protein
MNRAEARAAFHGVPWAPAGEGARTKVVQRGDVRIRLLELTPRFVEHGFCTRGHIGYVLEGEVELSFADGSLALRAGDAVFLRAGDEHGHRARAVTPRVLLFLVEDG